MVIDLWSFPITYDIFYAHILIVISCLFCISIFVFLIIHCNLMDDDLWSKLVVTFINIYQILLANFSLTEGNLIELT